MNPVFLFVMLIIWFFTGYFMGTIAGIAWKENQFYGHVGDIILGAVVSMGTGVALLTLLHLMDDGNFIAAVISVLLAGGFSLAVLRLSRSVVKRVRILKKREQRRQQHK